MILRFDTLAHRKEHEGEIDEMVGAWTSNLTPEEVMARLQNAGVPAGVVENAADLYGDPQLRQRNLFWPMEHSEMGMFTHLGTSLELSKTPALPFSRVPAWGSTMSMCSPLSWARRMRSLSRSSLPACSNKWKALDALSERVCP